MFPAVYSWYMGKNHPLYPINLYKSQFYRIVVGECWRYIPIQSPCFMIWFFNIKKHSPTNSTSGDSFMMPKQQPCPCGNFPRREVNIVGQIRAPGPHASAHQEVIAPPEAS
jgi:hypothetical protein